MMSVHISSGLVLHPDDVWTKQFKPRSSSNDGVKSICLTEAEEEAIAREVYATHARIVSGPDHKRKHDSDDEEDDDDDEGPSAG
ncbi:hypothetical protein Tco_1510236 [Tanacetum coccineum]